MKITVTIKCFPENKHECINVFGAEYRHFREWVEDATLAGIWGLPHDNVTLRWLVESGRWEGDGVAKTFVRPNLPQVATRPLQCEMGSLPAVSETEESDMSATPGPIQNGYEWASIGIAGPQEVANGCMSMQMQGFEVFTVFPCKFRSSPLAPESSDIVVIVGRRPMKVVDANQGAANTNEPNAGTTAPGTVEGGTTDGDGR